MTRELVQLPSTVLLTRSVTVYKGSGLVLGMVKLKAWTVVELGAGLTEGLSVQV
jgi:hypothetical protein